MVNTPLKVECIYFKDNAEPLKNKTVWPLEGFLLVANDTSELPTWYNIDLIERMEGVTADKKPVKTKAAFF